ncbi:DUF6807 domain-containing protein [Pleomorphovibrio marinus]|uniref:DUF6807 domain-containing protein n=1 Tax=Pleomorphovibrio marinus TaxID=2164132 RepID=UPI002936FC9D|nr:PmoA family protein [Pleomorphovibrio marinus]
MKKKSKYHFLLISLLLLMVIGIAHISSARTNPDPMEKEERIQLVRNDDQKKVDVIIDGEHFTSYIYPETIEKPVLYPIKTSKGTFITRGYPIANRPGERVDHPHHVGLWLNYGDVNGLDFWNNSDAISAEKKPNYGSIIHREILHIESGKDEGILEVAMDWVDHQGKVLLKEQTKFVFKGKGNKRSIDRITTLTANGQKVNFTDNKEGMLGIRMARELEHPSDKPEKFTDAQGNPTDVPSMNNEGVSGKYKSSEGIEGDDVWGTRAKWMNLAGTIEGENISVAILDHPDNVGYPTYWHARGYGLYAANPLGQKAMSGGKDELNHSLNAGESMTFKHRILVYSGKAVKDKDVEKDYKTFTK